MKIATNPRLHLVGLPHTCTDHSVTVCAFTTKAEKFLRMMSDWEVLLYWGNKNDCPCTEHISLHNEDDRLRLYGVENVDQDSLPEVARNWDANSPEWTLFNTKAILELSKRVLPKDIILITGGCAAEPIINAFPDNIVCEWAVGYNGWCAPYVCFESYTWMANRYANRGIEDGRFYDTVIPNYFDPLEWSDQFPQKEDYLVFFGRMVHRKGIQLAAQIAERVGMPIKFAGPGVVRSKKGSIETIEGIKLEGDVEYVGVLNAEERWDLVSRARASLIPTLYLEPFGAVVVESLLMGTQPITTNFGAFPELVDKQFRFSTLAQGADVVNKPKPTPLELRQHALDRFSFDAIKPMYEEWFHRLRGLYNEGFYA